MQDVLTAAIEMHRSGQLGPASELYRQLLAREPENAEALHLLGVLHHQQGQHARAIELIGRAVALRPNAPAYHANLAEAYRASAISNAPLAVAAWHCRSGRITRKPSAIWARPCRDWGSTPSRSITPPRSGAAAKLRGGAQ